MLTNVPDLVGEWPDQWFYSVTGAMRQLKLARIKTTAGDRGAINIWLDDHGRWRGERMAYLITQSECNVRTQAELRRWLKDELPKIHGAAP